MSPGGVSFSAALRHRWWADAEGAVVPSAFQEMASVVHTEEEGLAGRAPGAGDPMVQGEAGVWGGARPQKDRNTLTMPAT